MSTKNESFVQLTFNIPFWQQLHDQLGEEYDSPNPIITNGNFQLKKESYIEKQINNSLWFPLLFEIKNQISHIIVSRVCNDFLRSKDKKE